MLGAFKRILAIILPHYDFPVISHCPLKYWNFESMRHWPEARPTMDYEFGVLRFFRILETLQKLGLKTTRIYEGSIGEETTYISDLFCYLEFVMVFWSFYDLSLA